MPDREILPSSFRDPSGFVFVENGVLFRQVNESYREDYDLLMSSGLYQKLVEAKLLLPHEEELSNGANPGAYKIVRPLRLPFISYPYEWCFSQLKDAALLTIAVQKLAMDHGMVLKDASAYNVQFHEGKPILIDTLSFEKYVEGLPWVAYKQFCQHFLAPLALMAHGDLRLNKLLQVNIDGVPLDLAANLLPKSTMMNMSLLTHLHMHAKSLQRYSKAEASTTIAQQKLPRISLIGIIDNLESAVKGLRLKGYESFWRDYYNEHNYSDNSFEAKKNTVNEFLTSVSPKMVWDLGANIGVFSRLSSKNGTFTLSTDMDALTVEANYLKAKEENDINLLPLIVDLSAPPPAIGWANQERMSLTERGPADAALALALIHHLAIGNNLPLDSVADYMSSITKHLIIEFVPKQDSQVKELLKMREDIFPDYNENGFEQAFERRFSIEKKTKLGDSERTLYLMKNKVIDASI